MGTLSKVAAPPLLVLLLVLYGRVTAATWCVARSDATRDALQTALDYACGAGADCAPIQQSGLCFLPNTIQAHASYAFNSYYMRKFMAPGSCDFSGTATVAKTDPSYGSCVYPASPSAAGGTITPGGGTTTPITTPISDTAPPPPSTTTPIYGSGVLTPVGTLASPPIPDSAFMEFTTARIFFPNIISMVFLFIFQPLDVFLA